MRDKDRKIDNLENQVKLHKDEILNFKKKKKHIEIL